jgi:putative polyhydroxyalkanoate system protein
MPRLTMDVPHELGKEEAGRRLKEKFSVVREKFGGQVNGLSETWDGDQLNFGFSAMGMKIAGTVTVGESDVRMAADLPFAAMMFKGTIESRIRGELGDLLA